jgi:catechol-2,3-dioxygenase
VVLHAKDWGIGGPQSFYRLVIQIDVGDLDIGGQAIGVDGEPVILARDGDASGPQVFDRLVAAAVAKLQFEGFPAEGVAEHLVSEADGEDWFFTD